MINIGREGILSMELTVRPQWVGIDLNGFQIVSLNDQEPNYRNYATWAIADKSRFPFT